MAGVHLDQRDHREHAQDRDLRREQPDLGLGVQFDADHADPGHREDEDHPEDRRPELRGGRPIGAEEQEHVAAGDGGEAGHDDQVRDDHAPAAHPAGRRPEGSRRPAEGRATVRIDPVQVLVGRCDEVHRNERDQEDGGRVQPHCGGHDPETGRQAVARRGRGHADHDGGRQPDRTSLEPFRVGVLVGPLLHHRCHALPDPSVSSKRRRLQRNPPRKPPFTTTLEPTGTKTCQIVRSATRVSSEFSYRSRKNRRDRVRRCRHGGAATPWRPVPPR